MLPNLLKFLALVLGFALWAALGYLGKVPLDPLIALLQMGLGGLITHMLQTGTPSPDAPATPAAVPRSPPSPAAQAATQGGFATLGALGLIAAVALGALLAGCANPPTVTQANQIRMACAADAGIRPSVDILLAVPGLANPEEVAAVVAARAVIDQVCKSPEAPFAGGDPYVAVTQATGTLTGILVQLQTRRAGK